MELAPPGFGSYCPVIVNRDGKMTVVWWLCSDFETAEAYANGFVTKGFAYGSTVMEVLRPGMYQ
jgi:hypothetical protein